MLQNGVCVDPPVKCDLPKVLQNGVCVDPPVKCDLPKVSKNGVCVYPPVLCSNYLYKSNNKCIDSIELLKPDFGDPSLCISTRRLSKSYNDMCVKVIDVNDTIIEIGFDSNGMIDYEIFKKLQEPVHVMVWYDQSGFNRHVSNIEARNELPILMFLVMLNGIKKPTISFAQDTMATNGTSSDTLGLNNPSHTIMSSIKTVTKNSDVQFIYSSIQEGVNEMHLNGSAGVRVLDDFTTTTTYTDMGTVGQYSDGEWHYMVSGVNDNKASIRVDGSSTTSNPTSSIQVNDNTYPLYIGYRDSSYNGFFQGYISEFIIFPLKWSDSPAYDVYLSGLKNYNENGYS